MEEVTIPVRDFAVTASVHGVGDTAVVVGPGAGGNRRTPLLLGLAKVIAASRRQAILYNFVYTERRRRIPDPPELLELTTASVGEYARRHRGARRIVYGGKSMGGRIASQAVARGTAADGLVFLGYPLHPPGRTDQLRDKHFPQVNVPMLFVQGTRDAFARWDLLEALLASLGDRARLFRVEAGDHSFVVPRSDGRSHAEVEGQIGQAVVGWLADERL